MELPLTDTHLAAIISEYFETPIDAHEIHIVSRSEDEGYIVEYVIEESYSCNPEAGPEQDDWTPEQRYTFLVPANGDSTQVQELIVMNAWCWDSDSFPEPEDTGQIYDEWGQPMGYPDEDPAWLDTTRPSMQGSHRRRCRRDSHSIYEHMRWQKPTCWKAWRANQCRACTPRSNHEMFRFKLVEQGDTRSHARVRDSHEALPFDGGLCHPFHRWG